MDYRLQKLITPTPIQFQPKRFLRGDPAQNFINPGIGGAIQMYSFYVPLYSSKNVLQKEKIATTQEGAGIELNQNTSQSQKTDLVQDTIQPENHQRLIENEDNVVLDQLKDNKMDADIKQSFLHPKIKIGNAEFLANDKKSAETKRVPQVKKSPQMKNSHKFQFYD